MPRSPAPGWPPSRKPGGQVSASPLPLRAPGRCSGLAGVSAVGAHPPTAALSLAPSSLLVGCPRAFCQNYQSGFLVFYCCVTKYHKRSNLRQQEFIVSVSVGQKSGRGMAGVSAQGLTGLKSGSAGAGLPRGLRLLFPAHWWWQNSVPSAGESRCPFFAGYQPGAALSLERPLRPLPCDPSNSKVINGKSLPH